MFETTTRLVISTTSMMSRIFRQLLVTTKRATSATAVTLVNSPKDIAWTIIEEIVVIRRKVFRFISKYTTILASALKSSPKEDEALPQKENEDLAGEEPIVYKAVQHPYESQPSVSLSERVREFLSSLFSKETARKRSRRPRKEPTWFDFLPASWRGHDEDGVPLWVWLGILAIPVILLLSSLMPEYGEPIRGATGALGSAVIFLLKLPLNFVKVLWSLGLDLLWFLSQLSLSLVANVFSLLISTLYLTYGFVATVSSQFVQHLATGTNSVLSGTGSLLDKGLEVALLLSKWLLDEGWLYALSLLPLAFVMVFKERVGEFLSPKEMIVIPLEDDELSDMDEEEKDSLREKVTSMLSGIFQSKPKPKKKVRKPRKRHTWYDYLPSSWRDHDEEGVPIWLWIVLVMLPLTLIFSNLLPQCSKIVVQAGSDLLRALGAGVYKAFSIPAKVVISGANSTFSLGSDLVKSGSNAFTSTYDSFLTLISLILSLPIMLGGWILYSGTKLGLLFLDLLKVLGSALYSLLSIPVQIVRAGTNSTLTLGAEVVKIGSNVVAYSSENLMSLASLVVFLPIAAGGWILSSVTSLGNAVTETIRSFLAIIMSGVKSSFSYPSEVVPDWRIMLPIFLPLFLLWRFKDHFKGAVVEDQQKPVEELEVSDDDEELLEGDPEPQLQSRVANFVRSSFSWLPWIGRGRPTGPAKMSRARRKTGTWLDYLPASWRDHDEEGVPLWLWGILVILPFALTLSVFVPGFARAVKEGCIMTFQGLVALATDIAHFTLQATKSVLIWSFDAGKALLYLPLSTLEVTSNLISTSASQLWTGFAFGLEALSNLASSGAELAMLTLAQTWSLVWLLWWWLLAGLLVIMALKRLSDHYQNHNEERPPEEEPIVTRSRARKSLAAAPKHKSRKRHTWLDFLPASWRGHDEEGVPLWLWGIIMILSIALISSAVVPGLTPGNIWSQVKTSSRTIGSSLGKALLAAWMLSYRILMVPFYILRGMLEIVITTFNETSLHFVELAKASLDIVLSITSAPVLMAEYLWDFLLGGSLFFGSLIAGSVGVVWSGIVALFRGFASFFGHGVQLAMEVLQGLLSTLNSTATSAFAAVLAIPSNWLLLVKSVSSTAVVPLSTAATALTPLANWIGVWGWMILLLLVLIPFAFSLAAKLWEKFNETRAEMADAQGYDSAEEWEAEPEIQAEHREHLQTPNYNLYDYLPALWRPTRKAGPTKRRTARRGKTGTWQDYLPAAWKDHDEDGMPIWLWFLLALLPLALIMATLMPGYSAQAVGAIYEASSAASGVALKVVALPLHAITVGLEAGGSVAANVTSLGIVEVDKIINSTVQFGQNASATVFRLTAYSASFVIDGATYILALPLKAGQFVVENGAASILQGTGYISNFLETVWSALTSGFGWVTTVPVQQTEEVLSGLGKGSVVIANSTKQTLEAVSSAIGEAGHEAVDKGYEATVEAIDSISDGLSGVVTSTSEIASSAHDGLCQFASWAFGVISVPFVGIWNGAIFASQNIIHFMESGFTLVFHGVFGLGSLIWQLIAGFFRLIWSMLAWLMVGTRRGPVQWQQVDNDQVLEMVMRSQRFRDIVADLTQDEVNKLRSEVDQRLTAFRAELTGKESPEFQKALDDITESLESRLKEVELSSKKCCKTNADLGQLIKSEVESAWKHNATVLRDWMNGKFATKGDMEAKKDELVEAVMGRVMANFTEPEYGNHDNDPFAAPSALEVEKMIRTALIRYDADKTGTFDYALETSGGSVISTR